MSFSFTKLSGAGNTFAMIDAREKSAYHAQRFTRPTREWVARLCDPLFGWGVDGVLLLGTGRDGADFDWDFYNADGSSAEFCGNAARCAGLFCEQTLGHRGDVRFSTVAGIVEVKHLADGRWRVLMPELRGRVEAKNLRLPSGDVEGFTINTGVPHFVVPLLAGENLAAELCSALRHHESWGTAGSNVTLLEISSENSGRAKTFERGVENFTAACGTGAVAAALVLAKERAGEYKVTMPGGELEIHWDGDRPVLIGPAVVVGEFRPAKEIFG